MKPSVQTKISRNGKLLISLLLLLVIGVGLWWYANQQTGATDLTNGSKVIVVKSPPDYCAGNSLAQNIIVSISARQLWACAGTRTVYSSAVVTGMEQYPTDLTPTGSYQIYAKETNINLSGSDSTGSWNEFVYYWMPFLDNQYGAYGIHDATWRAANAFGNISPDSSNASHGCVETPLTTAKWLYNWAIVGTTVTIES